MNSRIPPIPAPASPTQTMKFEIKAYFGEMVRTIPGEAKVLQGKTDLPKLLISALTAMAEGGNFPPGTTSISIKAELE